jgi:hypothetical protein
MTEGYIYCFSNPSMPGILKIGMTERTPEARLIEANASDTWRPPTPYGIEFAKKVSNAKEKEKTLHILLEQYTDRINSRREFFRVSLEEVRKFFDLMDGEFWTGSMNTEEEDDDENETSTLHINIKGCRDMTKCFKNGQKIRHKIGINKILIGKYDSSINGIVCDEKIYYSLSAMATEHNKTELPHRINHSANGWKECECEDVDGNWISTYSLPV